jgi:hypothetical protein
VTAAARQEDHVSRLEPTRLSLRIGDPRMPIDHRVKEAPADRPTLEAPRGPQPAMTEDRATHFETAEQGAENVHLRSEDRRIDKKEPLWMIVNFSRSYE